MTNMQQLDLKLYAQPWDQRCGPKPSAPQRPSLFSKTCVEAISRLPSCSSTMIFWPKYSPNQETASTKPLHTITIIARSRKSQSLLKKKSSRRVQNSQANWIIWYCRCSSSHLRTINKENEWLSSNKARRSLLEKN